MNDYIWVGTEEQFQDITDYGEDVMYIIVEEVIVIIF